MTTKQLKLEFRISSEFLHQAAPEYFNYTELLEDAKFNLNLSRNGMEGYDDIDLLVMFTGDSYYVSVELLSEGEKGRKMENIKLTRGSYHSILSTSSEYLFRHGNTSTIVIDLTIKPIMDKTKFILPYPTALELTSDSHQETIFDVAIVVGEEKFQAHRGFLVMISPVFRAMFTHDTKEAQTGVVDIIDFDMATVTNALNFCYGKDTGPKTEAEVWQMLRFADKYDIQTVIKRCDEALGTHITTENFIDIADYAWKSNKDALKTHCVEFFRQKHAHITLTPGFAQLPLSVSHEIIQQAVASQQ